MARTLSTLTLFALIVIHASLSTIAEDKTQQKSNTKSVSLLKKSKLDNWGYFLVKEKNIEKEPKMSDVWAIDKGVLACKGVPMGYLSTNQKYENFKLTFQWRWPKGVEPTNSGVFIRITGEDRALPKCIEVQLCHKKAGDLIGFHGMTLQGPADRLVKKESPIGGAVSILSRTDSNELPPGKWNQGKVLVQGDTITVWINGRKVNHATGIPVHAGKIGLQSEGGQVEFKTVKIVKNN